MQLLILRFWFIRNRIHLESMHDWCEPLLTISIQVHVDIGSTSSHSPVTVLMGQQPTEEAAYDWKGNSTKIGFSSLRKEEALGGVRGLNKVNKLWLPQTHAVKTNSSRVWPPGPPAWNHHILGTLASWCLNFFICKICIQVPGRGIYQTPSKPIY